jgi:hypothetical protein
VASYGYIVDNLGIGRHAPFWYSLDVAGAARLPQISSVFISASSINANYFVGDGSLLRNVTTLAILESF